MSLVPVREKANFSCLRETDRIEPIRNSNRRIKDQSRRLRVYTS